jgi:glycine/D-amino acid oxidase-like deaminating enzyme
MNLSYWERTSFLQNYDYTIVGAGIVGLFAAIEIKKRDGQAKVLVIERSAIPDGASTKNAGFACFGSLSEIIQHRNNTSEIEFKNLVAKRVAGLKKMREELGDFNIGFHLNGGYEVFTKKDEKIFNQCINSIAEYNLLLQNIFNDEVYELRDNDIEKLKFNNVEHLIYTKHEAQIHSGKMMQTLIKKAFEYGVQILFNTELLSFENHDTIVLNTSIGKIYTNKLLVTNNAFAKKLFSDLELKPGRGQIIVTSEVKDLKLKGNFHYDKGFYYFRNIDNRVLIGGGRNLDFKAEETYDDGETEIVQKELRRLLSEVILPDVNYNIEYSWSGTMAFGNDITPIVKELQKNIYCAVRCNGMGVAMGSLLAEDVVQLAMN